MEKVYVASTNPVKINAIMMGFEKTFEKKIEIIGVKAESGVSDQPMTSDETFQGALNRVNAIKKDYKDGDYWVGIEGGLEEDNNGEFRVFAWVCVISKLGRMSKSRTADFELPEKVAELIKDGMELGHADDKVFGHTNSKQSNGSVGILTHDIITRTTYYEHAVILALVPFKNKDIY